MVVELSVIAETGIRVLAHYETLIVQKVFLALARKTEYRYIRADGVKQIFFQDRVETG